jgi:mannose-6-phosphate isomerase
MKLYPLQFEPVFRSYIWGGRRLGERLGKPIGTAPRYAESWEIVDHGSDQSVICQGPLRGRTLAELVKECPSELFGEDKNNFAAFPLLLKYLDCNRVLSVQVHPDDKYAAKLNPPDLGKTEAWYVIDTEPGAVIYAGLRAGVNREIFATSIQAGRLVDALNTITPKPGDCIFIPAGTVHALGAGILVAEIQQSSDTTFRVFDWDRLGDDGLPRPLHIEAALEVTDYLRGPVVPQIAIPLADGGERLVACDKFILDRYQRTQPFTLSGGSCRLVTIVSGGATLVWEGLETKLPLGQTVLLPAAIGDCDFVPWNDGVTLLTASP